MDQRQQSETEVVRHEHTLRDDEHPEHRRLRASVESRLFGGEGEVTKVARFTVLERVGSGGMGIVYAAYDPELDRKVALKLLRPGARGKDGGSAGRTRLLREAQAMARLTHPNVVRVYDAGAFEDHIYLVMEFVEGQTLREWTASERRPWRAVVDVFLAAGRGLAAAHAAGLVHRDFKPANVLVAADGRVLVVDFGLARAAQLRDPSSASDVEGSSAQAREISLDSELTVAGTVMGTPAYMAPEQLAGDPADGRADQFGFCVALHEAVYGIRPFAGENAQDLWEQIADGRIREPPAGSWVPVWIRKVILRGLANDPDQRHRSMDELLAQLGRDSSRARRRFVAVLLAGAGLTAVGVFASSPSDSGCQGADGRLVGIWDGARNDEVMRAFTATGLPFAADAAGRVASRLDQYTADWLVAHREACEATRDRREQSETILGVRMLCLDERLTQVATLADRFAQADRGVVERAVGAVHSLGNLDDCASAAKIGALVQEDQEDQEAAAGLRSRAAEALMLREIGKYRDAAALAEPVAREAGELGIRSAQAQAQIVLGTALGELGQGRECERILLEAAAAAREANRGVIEAQALSHLIYQIGYRDKRHAEGMRLLTLARAALSASDGDESVRARLMVGEGTMHLVAGRPVEAEAVYRDAIVVVRETSRDGVGVSSALANYASILVNLGRHQESIVVLKEALELREQTFGPHHPFVANVLDTLGAAHDELGHTNEALELFGRALTIFEGAFGPDHPKVAGALANIALILARQRNLAAALAYQRRAAVAIERSVGADHPMAAKAAYNQAGVLIEMGRHREGYELVKRAVAVFERVYGVGDRRWRIAIGRLASAEATMGRPERALELLERARAQDASEADVAGQESLQLGRVLRELERYREAAAELERAIPVLDADAARPIDAATARFELAQALWHLGDRARARVFATEARDALARAGPNFEELRSRVEHWMDSHAG